MLWEIKVLFQSEKLTRLRSSRDITGNTEAFASDKLWRRPQSVCRFRNSIKRKKKRATMGQEATLANMKVDRMY
jgi:hypothetical protein